MSSAWEDQTEVNIRERAGKRKQKIVSDTTAAATRIRPQALRALLGPAGYDQNSSQA